MPHMAPYRSILPFMAPVFVSWINCLQFESSSRSIFRSSPSMTFFTLSMSPELEGFRESPFACGPLFALIVEAHDCGFWTVVGKSQNSHTRGRPYGGA